MEVILETIKVASRCEGRGTSLSVLAYALSKGYSIVYIPYGAQVPRSLTSKMTIPAKVNVGKINE